MYLSTHSFMPSQHVRASAWLEHSPFVFWLIDILRPSTTVELGVHNGFSFLSQCQIAKSINLHASIYAIDTWEGDEHAGFYDSKVFEKLEAEVRKLYPGMGRMIKSTFADARSEFDSGSVDLLHIDGRHRYEDVKGDFETWADTLSNRGIVLFHDTCVQRDDFGVHKFWSEISQAYPSFEFFHGNGLGILALGPEAPHQLKNLCSESWEVKSFVREAYSRLGQINSLDFENSRALSKQQATQAELRARIAEQLRENATLQTNLRNLEAEGATSINQNGSENAELRSSIQLLTEKNSRLLSQVKAAERKALAADKALQAVFQSTSWKITWIIRWLKLKLVAKNKHSPAQPVPVVKKPAVNVQAEMPLAPVSEADLAAVRASGLFDEHHYRTKYGAHLGVTDPLEHFCTIGWQNKFDPSSRFITASYVAANPTTAEVNPALHYWARVKDRPTPKWRPERLAVFTAISGSYDELWEPAIVDPAVDYIVFTDSDVPSSSVWQRRQFDYYHADPTRTARFIKTHPHLYLEDYSHSLWMDANLTLAASPFEMLRELDENSHFATWHHPLRNCIYQDADEVLKRSKDAGGVVQTQMDIYKREGFKEQTGLYETSVIFFDHHNPKVIAALNEWWKQIDNGSRRDQLSLPYVLSKHPLKVDYLADKGICMRSDHRLIYRRHITV